MHHRYKLGQVKPGSPRTMLVLVKNAVQVSVQVLQHYALKPLTTDAWEGSEPVVKDLEQLPCLNRMVTLAVSTHMEVSQTEG